VAIWLGAPAWAIGRGFVQRYFDNSLSYDSPQADKIRKAVKARQTDRGPSACPNADGGSLYRAWLIGADGETIAKRASCGRPCRTHRVQRGDGSDLAVHDRARRRTGSVPFAWLEHLQPASKYAMYARTNRSCRRLASFSLTNPFAHALGYEVNNAASKIYAVEGSCFRPRPLRGGLAGHESTSSATPPRNTHSCTPARSRR